MDPADQEEVPPSFTRPIKVTIRFVNGCEAGNYEFMPTEKGELIDPTKLQVRIYNSLKKWQMKWIKKHKVQVCAKDESQPGVNLFHTTVLLRTALDMYAYRHLAMGSTESLPTCRYESHAMHTTKGLLQKTYVKQSPGSDGAKVSQREFRRKVSKRRVTFSITPRAIEKGVKVADYITHKINTYLYGEFFLNVTLDVNDFVDRLRRQYGMEKERDRESARGYALVNKIPPLMIRHLQDKLSTEVALALTQSADRIVTRLVTFNRFLDDHKFNITEEPVTLHTKNAENKSLKTLAFDEDNREVLRSLGVGRFGYCKEKTRRMLCG